MLRTYKRYTTNKTNIPVKNGLRILDTYKLSKLSRYDPQNLNRPVTKIGSKTVINTLEAKRHRTG